MGRFSMRIAFATIFLVLLVGPAIQADSPNQVTVSLVAHAPRESDTSAAYTFDANQFRVANSDLPIGVFDSGIGGLTVLEAILTIDSFDNDSLVPKADGQPDFANEHFIYLGDQANMPYGNYSIRGKESYLRELIVKDAIFLLGKRFWQNEKAPAPSLTKSPVKAIVIACNTATAYGLEDIRTALKTWQVSVPVIGVVEAGARGVSETITSKAGQRSVGVLATVGTCSSMAYPKAIASATGLAGKQAPEVVQQGSANLANAIEASPSTISDCIRDDVRQLVETHKQSGSLTALDTIVLGCTHFPLVQDEIQKELNDLRNLVENGSHPYKDFIASNIEFVNPATLTAKELFRELARNRLQRADRLEKSTHADQFYISVPDGTNAELPINADGTLTTEYKYSRLPGLLHVEETRNVPMAKHLLPAASLNLIQQRLPEVWKRMTFHSE
jgi:glutamate racemase